MIDQLSFENAFASYYYRDDILTVDLHSELILDPDVFAKLIGDLKTYANSGQSPILILIPKKVTLLDEEVFAFLKKENLGLSALSMAVVLPNRFKTFTLNMGLSMKGIKNLRYFPKKSAAKLWLMRYLDNPGVEY